MSTGFEEVNQTQLYYQVEGNGPALVLVHAGIADSRMWDQQVTAFREHFRTVTYDQRGCGQSLMPGVAYSDAADLHELLGKLGIKKAHCLGLSRGAAIALEFALTYPERVSSLILACPGGSTGQPSDELKAKFAEIDAALESGDLDKAVELENRLWVDGPNRTPEQVDHTVQDRIREMNTNNFKHDNPDASQIHPEKPLSERLGEIQVPTLIINSSGDVADIIRNGEVLAKGIPGAQIILMEGLGHVPNMEQPEAFNQIVLKFLNN